MMSEQSEALLVLTTLATWLLNGTLLLGLVWLARRAFRRMSPATEELLWKGALAASLVSALVAPSLSPMGRLVLRGGQDQEADGPSRLTAGLVAGVPEMVPTGAAGTSPRPRSLDAAMGDVVSRRPEDAADPMESRRAMSGRSRRATEAGALVPAVLRGSLGAAPAASDGPAREAGSSRAEVGTAALLPRLAASVEQVSPSTLLLLAWAVLALAGLSVHAARRLSLRRALGDRLPVRDAKLLSQLDALRRRAGLRRPLRLTTSVALAGPAALGGDEICLPPRALRESSPGSQAAMLAHELAHLERRDPRWRAALDLLVALVPFHPLHRAARVRLATLSELLCDDRAVGLTGRPRTFAAALAEVATWIAASGQRLPVAAMAHHDSDLVTRVQRLVSGCRPAPVSRTRALALGAVLATFGACGVPVVMGDDSVGPLDRLLAALRGLHVSSEAPSAPAVMARPRAAEVRAQDGWVHYSGDVEASVRDGRLARLVIGGQAFDVASEGDGLRLSGAGLVLHVERLDLVREGGQGRLDLLVGEQARALADVLGRGVRSVAVAPVDLVEPSADVDLQEPLELLEPEEVEALEDGWDDFDEEWAGFDDEFDDGWDEFDDEFEDGWDEFDDEWAAFEEEWSAQEDAWDEFEDPSPEAEALRAEFESAMLACQDEWASLAADFEAASEDASRTFEELRSQLGSEFEQAQREFEAELVQIWGVEWEQGLAGELAGLEAEWDASLDLLEAELEQTLSDFDGPEEALESWIEAWEERYESTANQAEEDLDERQSQGERELEAQERLAERRLEAAERTLDRREQQGERAYEREQARFELQHERAVEALERRMEALGARYERSREQFGRTGERDCDHDCEHACAHGCTHPEVPDCDEEPEECEPVDSPSGHGHQHHPGGESGPDAPAPVPGDDEVVRGGEALRPFAARPSGHAVASGS